MTGVDRYGFDMSAITSHGPRPVRLAFGKPVSTPEEVLAALISMVKDATSKLAGGHCNRPASRSRLKVLNCGSMSRHSPQDTGASVVGNGPVASMAGQLCQGVPGKA